MDSTASTTVTADEVAETIRNAAAWWRLAADAVDDGDHERAAMFAQLGQLGTYDGIERIAALTPDGEVT